MKKYSGKSKYIFLLGDGMADYPIEALGGKTPLETAHTPNMDRIAECRIGRVKTIPDGMEPGSDVANLSLLGYDPKICHTGRSPLEAASMGVELGLNDVAFRMNLVTLDRKSEQEILMVSHSSGDITSGESGEIVDTVIREMRIPGIAIYPGVAYRHLLVWDRGPEEAKTIPPHDVLDKNMANYLNRAQDDPIVRMIRSSWDILEKHPVNAERRSRGLKEANSIWLWGQGKAPRLDPFTDKFGLRGGVISAVDLLKGMGVYAGLEPINVEGATGYLDTNYRGKVEAAIGGLRHLDFIFLHVEAPDEASHNGLLDEKIQAIEAFDERIVGAILRGMERFEDFGIMVASDHYTPISKKTHTSEPAPFAWASKGELLAGGRGQGFSEAHAGASGLEFDSGHDLLPAFLGLS